MALETPLTAADYRQVFIKAGLWAGSKDWGAYEIGKRILRQMNLSPDDYEEGIKMLLAYLCL